MKEIKLMDGVQRKELEHIISERFVLSNTRHPFLVRMHCWFRNADKIYNILDFVPGGELFAQMRDTATISLRQIRLYAAEIALALEYLHKKGVAYRDLKPENILLTVSGHIKLTDFGLSKVAEPDATSCGNTFCGTPEYMAPEVVKGEAHGCSVDWWALGVLVYRLVFGAPPFFSRDRGAMFDKIRLEAPRIPPDTPPPVRDFIEALLEKDPRARLGTGRDGAAHVKAHAFFAHFDWDKVLHRAYRPEIVPHVSVAFVGAGSPFERDSATSLVPRSAVSGALAASPRAARYPTPTPRDLLLPEAIVPDGFSKDLISPTDDAPSPELFSAVVLEETSVSVMFSIPSFSLSPDAAPSDSASRPAGSRFRHSAGSEGSDADAYRAFRERQLGLGTDSFAALAHVSGIGDEGFNEFCENHLTDGGRAPDAINDIPLSPFMSSPSPTVVPSHSSENTSEIEGHLDIIDDDISTVSIQSSRSDIQQDYLQLIDHQSLSDF